MITLWALKKNFKPCLTGGSMEFLILGVVSALNFIIIKTKLDKKRFEDAGFDFLLMGT